MQIMEILSSELRAWENRSDLNRFMNDQCLIYSPKKLMTLRNDILKQTEDYQKTIEKELNRSITGMRLSSLGYLVSSNSKAKKSYYRQKRGEFNTLEKVYGQYCYNKNLLESLERLSVEGGIGIYSTPYKRNMVNGKYYPTTISFSHIGEKLISIMENMDEMVLISVSIIEPELYILGSKSEQNSFLNNFPQTLITEKVKQELPFLTDLSKNEDVNLYTALLQGFNDEAVKEIFNPVNVNEWVESFKKEFPFYFNNINKMREEFDYNGYILTGTKTRIIRKRNLVFNRNVYLQQLPSIYANTVLTDYMEVWLYRLFLSGVTVNGIFKNKIVFQVPKDYNLDSLKLNRFYTHIEIIG